MKTKTSLTYNLSPRHKAMLHFLVPIRLFGIQFNHLCFIFSQKFVSISSISLIVLLFFNTLFLKAPFSPIYEYNVKKLYL